VSRRTKIVCTVGPATASPERIRDLVRAGMDVARLNFSHGARDDHKRVYEMVRQAAEVAGFADAVIVGSAFVTAAERAGAAGVRTLAAELAAGVRRAGAPQPA
jgi:hypothetical protein